MKRLTIMLFSWTSVVPLVAFAGGIPEEHLANEEHKDRLEQARRLVSHGDYPPAVRELRKLLRRAGDRLVEVSDGQYRSLRECCWNELAKMPEEAFPRRRSQGASAVRRQFAAAMRDGDTQVLDELADDLFWNPFGEQTLDRLGEIHLSHGRFQRAIECWQRLIDLRDRSDASVAIWKAKVAFAHQQLGNDSAVNGILSWLRLTASDARAVIAGQNRLLVEYVESLADVDDETVTRRDDWPMPGGRPSRSGIGAPLDGFGRTLWKCETAGRARVSIADGIAFVLTADELSARDVTTGRLVWKKAWQSKADDLAAVFSPTAAEGLVFLPDQRQTSAIVAIQAMTGKLAVRFAVSVPGDGSVVVDGSPVTVDGRIYCSFQATDASGTAYYVRAVDLATKRLLWQTKVCELSGKVGQVGRPAPLAAFGSTLVASTGMGLVAALDADIGDYRWAVEYVGTGLRSNGQPAVAPIVSDGVAHVAPADANLLFGIDVRTGQIRWKTSIGKAAAVFPSRDRAVLIAEDSITAVGSLLGKRRWRNDVPVAGMVAPPLSAGRLFLLPCAEHIVTLDSSTGRSRQPIGWPGGAEAGSVMTCREAVLIVGGSGVEAYQNSQP